VSVHVGFYVVGLDLSLTAPGVAGIGPAGVVVDTIRIPGKLTDVPRIDHIAEQLQVWCAGADLVVMEGPSYGNQGSGRQSGHHERAGLWWIVKRQVVHAGLPLAIVPPATLKRFATGRGTADKTAMTLAAARRFPGVEFGDDNQVDACWLAAAGAQRLGFPVVALPKPQVSVLDDGIVWPATLDTLEAIR